MGLVCFVSFRILEKSDIVRYNRYDTLKEDKKGGLKLLIRHRIIRFTFVSVVTGVVRTTVVFWLTTYIADYLEFGAEKAALIYTGATLAISLTAFITIFVYEKMGYDMDKTMLLMFVISAICFLGVYFAKNPWVNVCLIVLAIMSSNGAATMLWSRYCPSLRNTGMVSGATGFLDFMSYMAAAVSSTVFANAVSVIGWSNLILVWFGLAISGVVIMLPNGFITNTSDTRIDC